MRSHTTVQQLFSPYHVYHTSDPTSITPVSSMLDQELCKDFLEDQRHRIKAPNDKVTASLMMKIYAQLYVTTQLHSLVEGDAVIRLPLEGCHLSHDRKLYVDETQCEVIRHEPEWGTFFSWVFAEHITPLIESFYHTTKVPKRILWENVAIRMNSFYRKSLQKGTAEANVNRLAEIYSYLKKADGSLFGLQENPLNLYLHEPTPTCETVTRKTCCYFYRLDKKEGELLHCQICPLKNK